MKHQNGQLEDIDAIDYLNYVRTLQGQVLPTKGGRATFRVAITNNEMHFIPSSSGKPRFTDFRKVLARYTKVKSLNTRDYHDVTWNASYHLTLLGMYLGSRKTNR